MEIPIVFITDNGYVLPTVVAITSLIANKKRESVYKIHIIVTEDVSLENRKKLSSCKGNNVTVELVTPSTSHIAGYTPQGHFTNTPLLKFDISEWLPQYDKILYLDGDIIVRKDLSELYDTPLNGYFLAGVSDMLVMIFPWLSECIQKHNLKNYFNSGIMLLNARLIRENKLKNIFYSETNNSRSVFQDQDVLNVVCRDKIFWLPLKYNNMVSNYIENDLSLLDINRHHKEAYSSIRSLINDSSIIHLCGPNKPWKYKKVFVGKEWMRYFRDSPFRAQKLNLISLENTVSLKRILKRIIKNMPILKQLIGRYLEIRNVLYENNAILKDIQHEMNNIKPLEIHSRVKNTEGESKP